MNGILIQFPKKERIKYTFNEKGGFRILFCIVFFAVSNPYTLFCSNVWINKFSLSNEQIIAKYVIDLALDTFNPQDYPWPTLI